MKKFEVGRTYEMRSAYDHECVWEFTVVGRTEKTVKLMRCGEVNTFRINKAVSEMDNREAVYPLGRYSMCPILRA